MPPFSQYRLDQILALLVGRLDAEFVPQFALQTFQRFPLATRVGVGLLLLSITLKVGDLGGVEFEKLVQCIVLEGPVLVLE